MAKSNPQARNERAAFWEKVWTVFVIAALLAIVGYSIYTQIIHHT